VSIWKVRKFKSHFGSLLFNDYTWYMRRNPYNVKGMVTQKVG